ncbi:hypothetical protein [Frankia sp. Cj5]|uniref:hypothetical protein n=1 Tax=Frankia sp. Cj5 TaxID=2880978 RepID=UPI001EF50532|nr:hypothetical protein [Frankia sp. Cj5]
MTTPARTLRDLTYSGRFDLAELGRVAHAFLRTHLANETELARGLDVAARTSPYGGEVAASLESILRAADEGSVGFPARPRSCSAGGSLTNPQLSGMVIWIGTPETMIILKINSYL